MSRLNHRPLRLEALVALAGGIVLAATTTLIAVADSPDTAYCQSTTTTTGPAVVAIPTPGNVLGPDGPLGANGPLGPNGAICIAPAYLP